jgi:hypothetical protein
MTHDPNEPRDREPELSADPAADGNTISPLPGALYVVFGPDARQDLHDKVLVHARDLLGRPVILSGQQHRQFAATLHQRTVVDRPLSDLTFDLNLRYMEFNQYKLLDRGVLDVTYEDQSTRPGGHFFARGNLTGTIELMLTYVEQGTAFTLQYGDINEAYYNSLESALNDMVELLVKDGGGLYPRFRERILQVSADASGIGWGYGDNVGDLVATLECELGNTGENTATVPPSAREKGSVAAITPPQSPPPTGQEHRRTDPNCGIWPGPL